MADFLQKKTGKILMYEVTDKVYRRPFIKVEVPRYFYKYEDGKLIEVVKIIMEDRRDPDGLYSVEENVKRWVFEKNASYYITQVYGDHRVYKGCVKPPARWRKEYDNKWHFRSEGLKFDYYSWNAWYESWEQDSDFCDSLKKHTGLDIVGKQFHYHQYAGFAAPKKFDNSIKTVW